MCLNFCLQFLFNHLPHWNRHAQLIFNIVPAFLERRDCVNLLFFKVLHDAHDSV